MQNVSDFINAVGRPHIMRVTGVKTAAVTNWIARGSIPPEHSDVLKKLASRRGVECPTNLFRFTPPAQTMVPDSKKIKAAAKT